ncbi:MAG: dehydrogenase subunit [Paenibacillaceae bacterium]|jgi:NADH-quinone oxidoreductase subunit D|nr:dehydrogenase subunit [Paenibacillaceae bacterium]
MIKTQEIKINMGPQHPSTHGVYRCILSLDGETVTHAENVVGYLHRGIEKLAESRTYTQFIPYTDRFDYICALLNEIGYVEAVEKLGGIEVPERAKYIRVIMGEINRIANHLLYIASYALDFGGFTPWMYLFRDRERLLDLMEMVTGGRLTMNYMRIGGVAADLPEAFFPGIRSFLDDFPKLVQEYYDIFLGNEIMWGRAKGAGVLSKEMALEYGVTGPNLRASGVGFDLRKEEGSFYNRFDFQVPVREGGDSYDRLILRALEMQESAKIIAQALEQLPAEGPIIAKVPKVFKPAAGEVFHRVEAAKGQLGYYVVSDGTTKPYRVHVHSPSFVGLGMFPEICKGHNIQDAVAIFASIDIVLGEVDR